MSLSSIEVTIGIVLVCYVLYLFSSSFKYQVGKLTRFIIYDNFIVKIIRNKFLQVFIPTISAVYFLVIEHLPNKVQFILDDKDLKEGIVIYILGFSLLVTFIRGLADYIEDNSIAKRSKFTERFTLLTSKLVKTKLDRFKLQAGAITPSGDTFQSITQPDVQINTILSEVVSLFYNEFGIKENDLCVTIMHQDPTTDKWYFIFETNKSLKHTKPEVLMTNKSAALICLESGEPVFYPNKNVAAKKGMYFLSSRDEKAGEGSVFCYPAFTSNKDYEDKYIISFVTYGKNLCSAHDQEQSDAILNIFSDLCRRIDLELTLHSMKSWKFGYHTNKTRKKYE